MSSLLLRLLSASTLALLSLSVQAQDIQQWSCAWTGQWGEKNADIPLAPMSMQGYLFAADGGWVIRANSTDAYGPSRIRGGCAEGACWVEQKYTTADLKGQSYFFQLNTKETPLRNGVKTVNYTGTWGETEEAEQHHGVIELTASCKPVAGNSDSFDTLISKTLGWNSETY
ncbi:MAG: hypothetical protein ACO1RX_19850 [Candidatus Sericytochromatia bacterium]